MYPNSGWSFCLSGKLTQVSADKFSLNGVVDLGHEPLVLGGVERKGFEGELFVLARGLGLGELKEYDLGSDFLNSVSLLTDISITV